MKSALPYWLAFAVVLTAAYGGFKLYQVQQYQGGSSDSEISLPPLEEFELTDQDGKPFRSADLRGKVWVASFFFSTCPASCGRLNANIKDLTSLEELADVSWVSITVDPQTDTTGVLRAYADKLGADASRWRFCRSDDFAYIKRLSDEVLRVGGVSYKGHNDYVVVVDRDGEIAGMFDGFNSASLDQCVAALNRCLAKPAKQPAAVSQSAVSDDAGSDHEDTAAPADDASVQDASAT